MSLDKDFLSQCEQLKEYPELYFKVNDGYLQESLEFSDKHITKNGLKEQFAVLQRIATNNNYVIILYQDFVKHSFYFVCYNKDTLELRFNGGVILHGYQKETFSVELNPILEVHYSIHT